MERLQKVIATTGFCSRRKAEEYIAKGLVEVNGKIVTKLGTKVNYTDNIVVNGMALDTKEDKVYYLLNKPRGIITSVSDDKKRKTVVDLIKENKRIYPVGRLDYDTTGALILTNDGELTNLLLHPKNHIEKLYIAKINGIPTREQLSRISRGMVIDGKKTGKAKVKVKKVNKRDNSSVVTIAIYEGRNHQIKKLFEAIGYKVLKLRRYGISFLTVDDLKSGEYRKLSVKEVKKLYAQAKLDGND